MPRPKVARSKAHVGRFLVTFAAWSLALGWLFSNTTGSLGFTLKISMIAVPCASVMLASVGFAWKRKLAYTVILLTIYVMSVVIAKSSGLYGLVQQQMTTTHAFPSILANVYTAWLQTFPFVVLLLFVGRRPSSLWSQE